MKKIVFLILMTLSSTCFALTNSTPELNEVYQNILFIKSDAPDQNGDTAPGFCNATLLNPKMAITAAHCVYLNYISKDLNIVLEKGAYKYKTMPDGQRRRIGYVQNFTTNIRVHIEFSQQLKNKLDRTGFKTKISPNEDMAIIYWDENLDELKLEHYSEILSQLDFEKIKSNLVNYSPKVRSINPFSEMSLDTKRYAVLNDLKMTFSGYLESKSISRVEEGDSGSPLFVNLEGKEKIIGVVKGRGATVFSNWDAYTPVMNLSCEINQRIPKELKMNHCK